MLHRDETALIVIDVQAKLLPFIHEAEETVEQIIKLIKGFRIVGAPILVTEQYRKGVGETDRRVQEALTAPDPTSGTNHPFEPLEKMTFSCMLDDPFRAALKTADRRSLVLCGIESHVCVYQTAIHLLEHGHDVEIPVDAVSSRSPQNKETILQRMQSEGVKLTCVETVGFEMLERCGTDQFRQWSKVIK